MAAEPVAPLTITLRGLPGLEDQSWTVDNAEDGVVITVNGVDIVAIDLFYSGLAVGGPEPQAGAYDLPEDPCDEENRPKIVVGAWPDGEEWVRLHQVLLADLHESGKED